MIWLIIYLVGCLFSFMYAIYLVRDNGKLVVGDIVPLFIFVFGSWFIVIIAGVHTALYSEINNIIIWRKK